METFYEWDEAKRQSNLKKHGWDFLDAWRVYKNPGRMTVISPQGGETRKKAVAWVDEKLVTLTLVFVERTEAVRVISLRPASRKERRFYDEWQKYAALYE